MLLADVALSSTYDSRLVALSLAIAVLASYTALDLSGRLNALEARARLAWLIGGAIVMGMGIWSMNFVAMLALGLPIAISYDMLTVLLSMLPAIVASFGGLFLASRSSLSMKELLSGGVLMGIGIASMHYMGIYAIRMEATIQYNPVLLALSVAIAIGGSILGLWIAFQLRQQTSTTLEWTKIGGALVMGVAIVGMHYTAMKGAIFTPTNPTAVASETINGSLTTLAVAIGTATIVILGFALMTSFVERRLTREAKLLEEVEAQAKAEKLFTEITLRIRQSLHWDDILNTTVDEVRTALKTDRVIIYRFNSNGCGTIIAESVSPGWTTILGETVNDPMRSDYIEMYTIGQVQATSNVDKVGSTDFPKDILKDFQIKANLVAPILNHNHKILGLLCAHQCSQPRSWLKPEIDLVRKLAIQVGIALEQASLLDEAKLGRHELQLSDRAIAAVNHAIFITDAHQPNNPIIFCNPAFEKITGYSAQEALGRNYQFLLGKDTDQFTVQQIHNAMGNSCECQVAIENYRKDGTPFWCYLTVSPLPDAVGRVINYIFVLIDITEDKREREELRRSKETFYTQLLQLLGDLKEADKGDLTVRAEVTTGEIGVVADFFNAIIESLEKIVIQVKKATHKVNAYTVDNSTQIQQIAEQLLLLVEEITCTLEELSKMNVSIQAVAESARQTAQVAGTTSDTAEAALAAIDGTVNSILNWQQTVGQTAFKVKQIGDSSQKISFVVSLINQIAIQTNVLAINASTEAAWMGNEGRSFAIVAEQIGQLSIQSAEATKEIQQILENTQLETSEVVKAISLGTTQVLEKAHLVNDAKLSLGQILEVSQQIDQLVQLISTATVLQSQTSVSVASSMKQIALTLEETADSSRIVFSSLQETQELARQLQASSEIFKTGS